MRVADNDNLWGTPASARREGSHQDTQAHVPEADARQGNLAGRTLNQIRRMLKMAPNSVACCSILRWKSGLVSACALPHSQCSEGGCGSSASALRFCNQLYRARRCHTADAPAATHAASTTACSIVASGRPARLLAVGRGTRRFNQANNLSVYETRVAANRGSAQPSPCSAQRLAQT